MVLTTDIHLVPRLRMDRSVPPLPYTSSWHGWEQLYASKCTFMTLPNKEQCNLYTRLTTAMVLTSRSFDGVDV